MNTNDIREKLFSMQDLKYKKFHSSLCPNTDNIIGVRIPQIRNLVKEIITSDYKKFLDNNIPKYYEELVLQGLIIGNAKLSLDETFYYLEKFIPKINNWAVCDTTCSSLKIAKKNLDVMWIFLQKYLNSEQEFEIRFGLVMLLDYYLDDDKYIDKIFKIIDDINHEGYYVKMAIAWLISVAFIKQKEKTREYLMNNQLDKFTYNKSLQKIIESYRVSQKEKEEIIKLKRYD